MLPSNSMTNYWRDSLHKTMQIKIPTEIISEGKSEKKNVFLQVEIQSYYFGLVIYKR